MRNKFNIPVNKTESSIIPNTIDHYTSPLFGNINYSRQNSICNIMGIYLVKKHLKNEEDKFINE